MYEAFHKVFYRVFQMIFYKEKRAYRVYYISCSIRYSIRNSLSSL